MSKFHDSSTSKYQEESEDSEVEQFEVERFVQKERYEISNIVNEEEEDNDEEDINDNDEKDIKDIDEEDIDDEEIDIDDEEDTDDDDDDKEFDDSDDRSSDNFEDYWGNNPYLEFIDLNNQQEIFWYSNSQQQQQQEECNINSFEDLLFSLNGIESLNDLRGYSDINEQNNRFVMLGDSLASGGAYEYYNNDGSYYSQRADGSIVRRDKFGRERITPPEENPRMGRRYRPY